MGDNSIHICIPSPALQIISLLEDAGFEAWCVGGFVRDSIMGRPVHDVDLASSASWQQLKQLCEGAGIRTREIGIKHGTLTVLLDDEAIEVLKGGALFQFPGLNITESSEESKALNMDPSPKVIISASGMCDAGRIRHHLKHNLWRPESTVLFVGYQAEGTLGRRLIDGCDTVKILGEEIAVHAEIGTLPGMSGHADRNGLLAWLGGLETPPKAVFVNHGEDEVCDKFARTIQETFGYETHAPYSGACYDLRRGAFEFVAQGIPIGKQTQATVKKNQVFSDLVAAAKELLDMSRTLSGRSNRELKGYLTQIRSILKQMRE